MANPKISQFSGRPAARLIVAFALLATLLTVAVAGSAPAGAASVDPRVPGPSNPVGPTSWGALVDEPSFVLAVIPAPQRV